VPLRKALRLAAPLLVLALLWLAAQRLPVLRWVVEGAKLAHSAGPAGVLLTCAGIYVLTLLLLPIVPLTIAAGWLYGLWGALVSLAAAVASAATAFAVGRALGRTAAAQALLSPSRAASLPSC
jgi:uncharacterized membrane protein YdjX (TVP38/TMEM64 family)